MLDTPSACWHAGMRFVGRRSETLAVPERPQTLPLAIITVSEFLPSIPLL
jgi:hypothetical protein